MPFSDAALGAAINTLTPELTVHLHTGDPGTNGTANRVNAAELGAATIPDVGGFTVAGATATAAADVDFGTASAAITGVSWYSVFSGNTFWGRRELAAPVDIANGAAVVITAATFTITLTSTDN